MNLSRYHVIQEKNPREIVLLRGSGCKWRKCSFCDYHTDFSKNVEENYQLNLNILKEVSGCYGKLEVINSGSFCDLDSKTMDAILSICLEKAITEIHFECHWMHKQETFALREFFGKHKIAVKLKIGVETFQYHYRETILKKGLNEDEPEEIAAYFDEVCLLFGLDGQSITSMKEDIEIGLKYFERICINIMVENSTKIKPNPQVIQDFMTYLYPVYKKDDRVDILISNTDFGVGEKLSTS